MEKKPLVSIVTPCHNSADFIHRLLDSVLEQTYPFIEMITVDNDSKDDTAKVIHDYIPKFKQKGYLLTYIHEDDLGPSAGVQNGIRHIKGDYLVMPDSDDWYALSSSIETFVKSFEKLPDDYAIVRSQLLFIDEKNMQQIHCAYENFPEDDPGTLFEDCLFAKNGYIFAPIDFMIKVSKLREMTGMEIYNAYGVGQNRQICLPLHYKYKAWTIAKPLGCYLVRANSVSHGDHSKYPVKKNLYKQWPKYIDSIFSCIDTMPENDRLNYRCAYLRMMARNMLRMAILTGNKQDISIYLDDYAKHGGDDKKLLWNVKIDIYVMKLKKMVKKILGRL